MAWVHFFNKGNSVFSNGHKSLPKNFIDRPILCNWIFNNFILDGKPFPKDLQNFEIFVLVNSNLGRIPFSSLESPTTFDESSKVISVQFLFQILVC